MVKTLAQLGKTITESRDLWATVIEDNFKAKTDITYYIVEIVFDLDKQTVEINEELFVFDNNFDFLKNIVFLKTMGRRIKRPYLTVEPKKLEGAYVALFGKPNKKGNVPTEGDLSILLKAELPDSEEKNLMLEVLVKAFQLKTQFEEIFKKDGKINLKELEETFNLLKKEKIALLTFSVNDQSNNFHNKRLHSFKAYKKLVEAKYLPKLEIDDEASNKKLCYISGELSSAVETVSFKDRYNINKMFVQETKNFASNFNGKNFNKNYQVSKQNQLYINAGSDYLLKNLTVSIAEIRHAVIPEFINSNNVNPNLLKNVVENSELLFSLSEYKKLNNFVSRKSIDEFYWITFLNIDSDGNYFKTTNVIKNVNSLHIIKIIKKLAYINKAFKPWLGDKYAFNLYTIYKQIPVRKDIKTNPALKLIALILENRNIDPKVIYQSFVDVILCYWYERYDAYKNIRKLEIDFGFKDAVFVYTGLFQLLKILKNNTIMAEEENNKLTEDETSFLKGLDYNDSQKALFYLGRALNYTAYVQAEKGNKRAILAKLNFNGMDKRKIHLLSSALFEKGTQYSQVKNSSKPLLEKIQYDLAKFNKNFNINSWNMNPQEALFFILSGYTYGIKSKEIPAKKEGTNTNLNQKTN